MFAHQEWRFHCHVREDFTVPAEQQINSHVQQGPMETCQDWLKSSSAHCVTLGCTVKNQVQYILSPYISIIYLLHICITDIYLSLFFSCNPEMIRGKWLLCYFFKGRTLPTGPCAAGFVCVGGAAEPSPLDKLTGFPCPPGFFCSLGTSVPKSCPKGTFRCISCNMSVYYFILLY